MRQDAQTAQRASTSSGGFVRICIKQTFATNLVGLFKESEREPQISHETAAHLQTATEMKGAAREERDPLFPVSSEDVTLQPRDKFTHRTAARAKI